MNTNAAKAARPAASRNPAAYSDVPKAGQMAQQSASAQHQGFLSPVAAPPSAPATDSTFSLISDIANSAVKLQILQVRLRNGVLGLPTPDEDFPPLDTALNEKLCFISERVQQNIQLVCGLATYLGLDIA